MIGRPADPEGGRMFIEKPFLMNFSTPKVVACAVLLNAPAQGGRDFALK
jgi:hypothetical protein